LGFLVWTGLFFLRRRLARGTGEKVRFLPEVMENCLIIVCKPLWTMKKKHKPLLELKDVLDDGEEDEDASLLDNEEPPPVNTPKSERSSKRGSQVDSDKEDMTPELAFGEQ